MRPTSSWALTDPETLAHFRTFVRQKGVDALSDRQLARYDTLEVDITRERRVAKAATTVGQVDVKDTEGLELGVKEGFHEKRKCPLWIVQLSDRVDRATYRELNQKAKMLGGSYSRYKKADAGFQFLSEESARKFAVLSAWSRR